MLLVLATACSHVADRDRPPDPGGDSPDSGAASDSGGDSGDTAPDPAGGCGASTWTTGARSIDHGGIERTFRVYVPSGYDPAVSAPLVLAFHGWGGDGSEFIDDATVTAEADARGYVVLAPDGLGAEEDGSHPSSWSFSGSTTGLDGDGLNPDVAGDSTDICDDALTTDYTYPSCAAVAQNGCSWTQCRDDDVEFVLALVAAAEENLCIDADRVYATGGSNGGMFTWELGQEARSAGTFRALAPIVGLPHRGYLAPPARPDGLPVLLITGTRDHTVPPGAWEDTAYTTTSDGDTYYYTGATAITRVWAEASGCDTSSSATPVDVGVPDLDCRTYCDGAGALPPVLDSRSPMGHAYGLSWSWPLVLSFFDRYE